MLNKETKMKWYESIFPRVLSFLTGKARYRRAMPWFSDSWTGNAFRLWEKIFWRKYGVVFESTSTHYRGEDGEYHTVFEAHTFEAFVINMEYIFRAYLKGVILKIKTLRFAYRLPDFNIFNIFQPQLVFEGIRIIPNRNNPEGYAFAITFGNVGNLTSGNTWTHNNNGDFLFIGANSTADTISGIDFNGDGATQIGTTLNHSGIGRYMEIWGLVAPDSGSFTVTITGGANHVGISTSMSGVSQTTPTSGFNSGTSATSSLTVAVTTTTTGAYVVAFLVAVSYSSYGANITNVTNNSDPNVRLARSTNTVDATSFNMVVNTTGSNLNGMLAVGINPPSTSVSVDATVVTATFSIPAPTITAIENVTISQGTPPLATFSIPAFEVQVSVSVAPTVPVATFSIPPYDAYANDVVVSASVVTATFSIPEYTITAERYVTVEPTVPSATFSIPAYVVEIIVVAEVSPVTAIFSLPSPSVIIDVSITPTAQVLTFSIPAYSPSGTRMVEVSATVLTATFSTPAPTVSTVRSPTISPDPIALVMSIPVYTIIGDFWQEKFGQPSTSWSDKHSSPATSWSDKY